MTTEEKPNVVEFFCRHLVGLCITFRHKTHEDSVQPPRFATCSGTLIVVDDMLCFLTAGHVLKKLDELRASSSVEIVSTAWADTFGDKRVSDIPIPFNLRDARFFYIDDEDQGLDFGVVRIELHHARLLAKNGVVALQEANWAHQCDVSFDKYEMLGFPTELASDRVSSSGAGTVSPTMLGVRRVDALPIEHPPTRYPRFVGQIETDLPHNIEGMSGGPIFGFRFEPDGECRYWIVALQSSWNRNSRTVYGCSLPVLASLMTRWAQRSMEK